MNNKTKGGKVTLFSLLAGISGVLSIGVLVSSIVFSNVISRFMNGIGGNEIDETTLNEGTQLVEDIVEEGSVLLKNVDKALPLSDSEISKVNVFGWASYDWMTTTYGSGYSNTSLEKIKFYDALEEAGIEYNKTLYNMYKDFYSATTSGWGSPDLREYRGDVAVGTTKKFILHEPGKSYYTEDVINEAKNFSSTALVVIGRTGGEAADLRFYQEKQVQTNGSSSTTSDHSRTYLQISNEEEEMIEAAKRACDKVIVILNTSNTMELGFVEDSGIDACLLVGLTGLTGARSVVSLLNGKDLNGNLVSPSGRTVDTYAYDISSAPSSINSGYGGAKKYNGFTGYQKGYYDAFIDYYEDIYVGYRYYETADVEGYINYNDVVQYPFGYGLSYTNFEWVVEEVLINNEEQSYSSVVELKENDEIKITVRVKNVGDYPGKEVLQLYYSAPYYKGQIEKSSVVLGDYKKTNVINPGETDVVELNISLRDMASYDCYDKNGNGFTGYEVDGGNYAISFRECSHYGVVMGFDSKTNNQIRYTVKEGGYQYRVDEVTGEDVVNRFTGNDTLDGYPIDGSKETKTITYLSRSNFEATFPKAIVQRDRNNEAYEIASATVPTQRQLELTGYDNVEEPWVGLNADMPLSEMLEIESYEEDEWETFISQLTTDELFSLIRDGFFKTAALPSVDKPEYVDLDGPVGLNTRVMSDSGCQFVSYPSETMIAQTFNDDLAYAVGKSIGLEASNADAGIMGWYAPGANLHRNPYDGRNGEYYSEDTLLSGRCAANTIRGAKEEGLYCYMKHFAVNETESLREGLYTFLSEQTLREIYLKPFEIAVKEGGSNAVMTSMNRIGATWAGASYSLCTSILRNEWGFRGSIVTDWVDTGSTYMPAYKGIWAGNDIWLNNNAGNISPLFSDNLKDDYVFVTLAQKVAHNVLWTLIDTLQTAEGSLKEGASYDMSWGIYIVAIEMALLAGCGVSIFCLSKEIKKKKEQNS